MGLYSITYLYDICRQDHWSNTTTILHALQGILILHGTVWSRTGAGSGWLSSDCFCSLDMTFRYGCEAWPEHILLCYQLTKSTMLGQQQWLNWEQRRYYSDHDQSLDYSHRRPITVPQVDRQKPRCLPLEHGNSWQPCKSISLVSPLSSYHSSLITCIIFAWASGWPELCRRPSHSWANTKSSAWFCVALLARGRLQDIELALQYIENILTQQFTREGDVTYGTWVLVVARLITTLRRRLMACRHKDDYMSLWAHGDSLIKPKMSCNEKDLVAA